VRDAKPAVRPNLPTIKPDNVVLSEAPRPKAVPTNPWARPAGAAGKVGDDQRLQDTKHRPADAIQELGGNDEGRLGDQQEQHQSRQSTECAEQQWAAAPVLSLAADPWCRLSFGLQYWV